MERTLLLVDDEDNIVRALVRLLRRDGYKLLKANSGKAGLEVLKAHEVGVVISDQRMPEMSGVEFLSRVKELYPDTVRIVLSGYTELKSITDAINEGAIYKFLTKPWEDDLLRTNVKDAFEQFELRRENERLARELQAANEEFSKINEELEQRVEQKTREVMQNINALRISQDILEHLPLAVLGIGDDGVVAVANRSAHDLFRLEGGSLIGQAVDQVLPCVLNDLCNEESMESPSPPKTFPLDDGRNVEIRCCILGENTLVQGAVLVALER